MEKLPYEIRVRIFWSLKFRDKFACLFVSKDWNKWVKSCLFSDVSFIKDSTTLENAIAYFDKYSELANTVMYFKADDCDTIRVHLPRFPQLFPSMKKLVLRIDEPYNSALDTIPKLEPRTWTSLKEVVISEAIDCERPLMAELMLANVCPNIIQLSTGFSDSTPEPNTRKVFIDFFRSLKNAPRLSGLVLFSVCSDLADLEILHKNSPNLKSLKLFNSLFVELYNANPEHIEPVRLENLHIYCHDNIIDNDTPSIARLVDYVARKYTGLTSLTFTHAARPFILDEIHSQSERKMLPLFSKCPQLVHYDQMFCYLTDAITQEMDRCGIQLKEIALYVGKENVIHQYDALLMSKQSHFIEDISIHVIDDIIFDVEPLELTTEMKALEPLKQLNNLSSISLQSSMNQISLMLLLHYLIDLPQINAFTIHNTQVFLNQDIPQIPDTLHIKTIEIYALDIHSIEELDTINRIMKKLLRKCPDLERFSLEIDVDILIASETSLTEPCTLSLDFRTQKNLKSILIVNNGCSENLYYIAGNNPTPNGFYTHNVVQNKFIEKPFILTPNFHGFCTTILLKKPTYLNLIKV